MELSSDHLALRQATDDLVRILRPEVCEASSEGPRPWIGPASTPTGLAGTYGGHFLGQATAAAYSTVDPDRRLHSFHAYFLRSGRNDEAINYDVEAIRDGRSYATRRVQAWQDPGRTCFEMSASFASPEEGLSATLAEAPAELNVDPESLRTYRSWMEQLVTEGPIAMPIEWALRRYGIDIRPVHAPWHPNGFGPNKSINHWIRAAAPLPDDPALHVAALAYQSDESLADTVYAQFDLDWSDEANMLVSLDHAMWFHQPVDLNQWIYVEQYPLVATSGRGLAQARMWNKQGQLLATANQEVLLRTGL